MNGYLYNKDGVHFYIGEESNFINDENYGVILEIPSITRQLRVKLLSINMEKMLTMQIIVTIIKI